MKHLSLIIAAIFLPIACAWGNEGHEIVATIAQMYVKPSALETICEILQESDSGSSCHLASISTWADKHKSRQTAPMHFINPVDDNPPDECPFPGARGWDGKENANVLDAIKNTTSVLQRWVDKKASDAAANEALKFLVHFVGDMHQPLHLAGKERGGNEVKVHFGHKTTNLHAVWDTLLIEKFIQETPDNYTQPLSNKQVESALTGEQFDPYIRRIMWEGVLHSWKNEVKTWFRCPKKISANFPSSESQTVMGVDIHPDGPVVCPYYWSKPIHQLNCDIAWPAGIDDSGEMELDTPEYAEEIGRQMVVEQLLAKGGVRLAGILNYVFAR